MSKSLFLRIVNGVSEHNNFVQKRDAIGKLGFYTLQKNNICTPYASVWNINIYYR